MGRMRMCPLNRLGRCERIPTHCDRWLTDETLHRGFVSVPSCDCHREGLTKDALGMDFPVRGVSPPLVVQSN